MKKTLRFNMFLFLLLLFPAAIFAQATVSGSVIETSTKEPIPGANVIVKGTSAGTITDFDGNFSLNVSSFPVTIVVSSIGYNTTEMIVTSEQRVVVSLAEGVALDEVVLIGTRNPNRSSIDTAVPVDVIDVTELVTAGPQVNLNQILNYVAP